VVEHGTKAASINGYWPSREAMDDATLQKRDISVAGCQTNLSRDQANLFVSAA
jgi:hypothetical protein